MPGNAISSCSHCKRRSKKCLLSSNLNTEEEATVSSLVTEQRPLIVIKPYAKEKWQTIEEHRGSTTKRKSENDSKHQK
jgi:hypothetical protein